MSFLSHHSDLLCKKFPLSCSLLEALVEHSNIFELRWRGVLNIVERCLLFLEVHGGGLDELLEAPHTDKLGRDNAWVERVREADHLAILRIKIQDDGQHVSGDSLGDVAELED